MTVVYVREQGAVVRKDGEQLRVTQGKQALFEIPIATLEQLVLVGGVQITTPSATFLMHQGVDVVFMSTTGTYQGRLLRLESKFAKLRHIQLRAVDDDRFSLGIARQIVASKISNQRVILQRRYERDTRVKPLLDGMNEMLHRAEQASDLDQLRGFEGHAAALYFDGIRPFFPLDWNFQRREYYPPPDPANALLSFVYTLLRKDVETKIQLVGLDPYLGFFHALGYDRPALALDLMEEFRPSIADIVVLSLIMDGHITLKDFVVTKKSDFPIRMKPDAILRLVYAYEERLKDEIYHPLANGKTNYRRAIELQVRQISRILRGEATDYSGLVMR